MVLFKKAGSILKQSTSQISASSMINHVRYMSNKIYVGRLSYSTNDGELKDAFSSFGEVIQAKIMLDRESGKSRGSGFVTFREREDANAAVSAMNGQELNGRNLVVNFATDNSQRNG